MKVRFLGVTQGTYRTTSTKAPIRTLQIGKGEVIDLSDEKVKQLQKDYPKDWEIIDARETPNQVREPEVATPAKENTTKEEASTWTRKKTKA